MGLFDKKKKPASPAPANTAATALIAPSDYQNYFTATKSPKNDAQAATALIAPSDYVNYLDQKGGGKAQTSPKKTAAQADNTKIIAPSDYQNFYNAETGTGKAVTAATAKAGKKSVAATDVIAPRDYQHIFAGSPHDERGKQTAMFTKESSARSQSRPFKSKSSRRVDDESAASKSSRKSAARPKKQNDDEEEDSLSQKLAARRQQRGRRLSPHSPVDHDDDETSRILSQKKRDRKQQMGSSSRIRKADSDDLLKSRMQVAIRAPASERRGGRREAGGGKVQQLEESDGQTLMQRICDQLDDMMSSKSKEILVNKDNVRQYFRAHGVDVKV